MQIGLYLIVVGGVFEVFGVLLVASPWVHRTLASWRRRFVQVFIQVLRLLGKLRRWFRQIVLAWLRRSRIYVTTASVKMSATMTGTARARLQYGWNPTHPIDDQLTEIRRNIDRLHDQVQDLPGNLGPRWRADFQEFGVRWMDERLEPVRRDLDDVVLYPRARGWGVPTLVVGIILAVIGNGFALN